MATDAKSLTDHILLWVRYRWLLIGVAFVAALVTFIITSFIPKTYCSTATILPPFEGTNALPFLGGMSMDIFGTSEVPPSALVPLLKSRALKQQVNRRIDLLEHYKKKDTEKAFKAFEDHLKIEVETEESFGMVKIIAIALSVLDHNPEFSAQLVNTTVDEWNKLYLDINRRGASLRREYTEQNLSKNNEELATAEDSLRRFQEKYSIPAFNAQVEGTVQSMIDLEQQIMNTTIQIQVLEKIFQPGHPELERAKLMLQSLLKQKKSLEQPSDHESLLLPLNLAPEIGLMYTRLYRRVKTLEAIHTVLIQQYEQAKMQELRKTPSLRILDYGDVPLYKYKPHRLVLMTIVSVSVLFLTLIAIYFFDYLQRIRGTDEYRWIEELSGHLHADFTRIKRSKKK